MTMEEIANISPPSYREIFFIQIDPNLPSYAEATKQERVTEDQNFLVGSFTRYVCNVICFISFLGVWIWIEFLE